MNDRELIERAHTLVTAKDDITEATDALADATVALMRAKAKIDAGARFDARRGRFIATLTGVKFYILDPRPEEVVIEDMAHSLALRNRWNGAAQIAYSVAEHSLRVRDIVRWCFEHASGWGPFAEIHPTAYAKCEAFVLLHDGHEYIVPDMPRPIKAMLLGWDGIVVPIDRAIFLRYFGIDAMPPEIAAVVEWVDNLALEMEAEAFGPRGIMDMGVGNMIPHIDSPEGLLAAFPGFPATTPAEVEVELRAALEEVAAKFAPSAPADPAPVPQTLAEEAPSWKDALKPADEGPSKWEQMLGE